MTKHLTALATVFLVTCLAVTPTWAAPAVADGPPKTEGDPIIVVALAGYDSLHGDLDFLGELSGNPELAQSLDGLVAILTQFQGLAGLDKSRPLGGALTNDGAGDTVILAFIPVTDTERLLGALSNVLGQPEKIEDKLWRLKLDAVDAFVKESNGWAFVAPSEEALLHVPENPAKWLGALTATYDIAVQVNVQNVPKTFRDMFVQQLKVGMESGLHRKPEETDEDFDDRSAMLHRQIEALEEMANELDQLTIGQSIDPQGRRALLDLTLTSLPGSKLAQAFDNISKVQSVMTGFLMSDALARFHVASVISPEDVITMTELLDEGQKQVLQELDKDGDLDEQQKAVVKSLIDEFFAEMTATVEAGELDAGLVVVGEGPFSGAAGIRIHDGKKLEELFKRGLDLAMMSDEKDKPEVTYDLETYKDVRFHKLRTPPEKDKEFADVFGDDQVDIFFGFGDKTVFLAVGLKGLETVKSAIDKMADGPVTVEKPLELSVAVGPILRFAAKQNPDDPQLDVLVSSLEGEAKDRVNVTASSIKRGVTYRIELEEGVLKMFPTMGRLR